MRTLPEYSEVLWEEIKKLNIVEPKKGEGVLVMGMDVPEYLDTTKLVAAKHLKNVVVGVPRDAMESITSENVYHVLTIIAHSLLNYVMHLAGHKYYDDDNLVIILKNKMAHFMVAGVLLEDGIIV